MPASHTSSDDRLRAYREKRRAERSPEPFGGADRSLAGVFVVQKHAARRLHWDLRLEWGGVLKSWAVPKGPSLDPEEKRLAVETEDHPLEYQDFEGVIPQGNYGAGAMIVWDRGTWLPLEDPAQGLRKGKLLFELLGYKLRGVWTLFRTSGKQRQTSKEWLLVKKPDGWARRSHDPPPSERSVLSGLTVEELGQGVERSTELRRELEELDVPRRRLDPAQQRAMLAEVAEEPFSDEGWIFELKYDGFRLLAAKEDGRSRLFYRRGAEVSRLFPDVARVLAALPTEALILDGEVVVLDEESRPSFQRLQKRTQLSRRIDIQQAAVSLPATYFAFDLLAFEGHDLRPLPLVERKAFLSRLLPPTGPIRFADHVEERGEEFYRAVANMGLEGIVAKQADSIYRAGRSPAWLKIRIDRRDDFVIVGMSPPKGGRKGFGALHLAAWDIETEDSPELVYAGRVGTGFSESRLEDLYRRLDTIRREDPPCSGPLPSSSEHVWVEPELVCEVRYKEWTEEGLLRQPAFLGLREDKEIEECLLPRRRPGGTGLETAAADGAHERSVHLTNLDKVFWPQEGTTKGDLIAYYRAVSRWMLPYLEDRPLVLTRYPDGIDGKSFYQKNAPDFTPDWVQTERIWSEHSGRDIEYFVCQDVESLLFVANLGAILLHVWSSRLSSLQMPDWCILDLDPKEAPFSDVVEVASTVRRLCRDIGLESFVKTSGSTGLHVLLPLGRQCTYEQSRLLGELVARVVAHERPDIATVTRVVKRREGRVYLDYVQNGHGRLLVAPYSLRPLLGAPVSTPLRWDEVTPRLDLLDYTIASVPRRLASLDRDPWEGILSLTPDLTAILESLGERAAGLGQEASSPVE